MQQGALFSAVLHLAILALVLIGLPTSSNPFEVGSPVAVPIVFENAPIAEILQRAFEMLPIPPPSTSPTTRCAYMSSRRCGARAGT